MAKKVLLIQSRARPEMVAAEQAEYTRALEGAAELVAVSALDESIAWHSPEEVLAGYDAVLIGGSGEFDFDGGRAPEDAARVTAKNILARIEPTLAYLVRQDFPTLGICFGHQMIGQMQGAPVVNDHAQKKVGTFEVALTAESSGDPLMHGLPQRFMAQYGHKDSLTTLPAGATLLAQSSNCKFSALRYGKNVYTVQFHPELTAKDVLWKLQNSPGYLPEGEDGTEFVKESPEASTLIPKFVSMLA